MNLTKYIRSHKPLRGGLHLPDPLADAGHRDFRPLPPVADAEARVLRIALAQGQEPPATPTVSPGAAVAAGAVVARYADGLTVHAPVDGVARALGTVATPYAASAPSVELVPSADEIVPAAEMLTGQVTHPPAERSALIDLLRSAGVDPQAVSAFLRRAPAAIIINGLDASGWQHNRMQMLYGYGEVIVETASLLQRLFHVRRTYLAVDRAYASLVRLCERRSRRTPVRVAPVDNKYPQDHPHLLVKTIMQREVPLGKVPTDLGILVFDAADLVDMARALRGEPATHRLITVIGDAARDPGNYRVPLGASIAHIARAVGAESVAHCVADCLLSGPGLVTLDAVVTRRTQLVFLSSAAPGRPNPIPCVRCGFCQDACPVQLDPLALWQAALRRRFDRALGLHPAACIDCGLCDYVCPSELPLMGGVQECRRHVADR